MGKVTTVMILYLFYDGVSIFSNTGYLISEWNRPFFQQTFRCVIDGETHLQLITGFFKYKIYIYKQQSNLHNKCMQEKSRKPLLTLVSGFPLDYINKYHYRVMKYLIMCPLNLDV